MKNKCEIVGCEKEAYQSFFKYPNSKIWLCEEHTNEQLDVAFEEQQEYG